MSLNVMESDRKHDDSALKRAHIPLSDFGESSLSDVFERCCNFIDAACQEDGRVLLHCSRGQNRSPSIATAYLMLKHQMNLKQAFFYVRSRRPEFAPHEKYLAQLQDLDKCLFGNISLTEDDEPLSIQAIAQYVSRDMSEKK